MPFLFILLDTLSNTADASHTLNCKCSVALLLCNILFLYDDILQNL